MKEILTSDLVLSKNKLFYIMSCADNYATILPLRVSALLLAFGTQYFVNIAYFSGCFGATYTRRPPMSSFYTRVLSMNKESATLNCTQQQIYNKIDMHDMPNYFVKWRNE